MGFEFTPILFLYFSEVGFCNQLISDAFLFLIMRYFPAAVSLSHWSEICHWVDLMLRLRHDTQNVSPLQIRSLRWLSLLSAPMTHQLLLCAFSLTRVHPSQTCCYCAWNVCPWTAFCVGGLRLCKKPHSISVFLTLFMSSWQNQRKWIFVFFIVQGQLADMLAL